MSVRPDVTDRHTSKPSGATDFEWHHRIHFVKSSRLRRGYEKTQIPLRFALRAARQCDGYSSIQDEIHATNIQPLQAFRGIASGGAMAHNGGSCPIPLTPRTEAR